MKLAYIILAHTAPAHVARLVNRLQHIDDVFFIHIDSKVDIEIFKRELVNSSANFRFVNKRENGRWGDVGIVKATLNAMNDIVHEPTEFDHVILLSGADYPIKKTTEIRQFYSENKDFTFMTFEPFPVRRLNFEGMDRINCYTYNFLGKRETYLPLGWTKHLSLKGKLFNLVLGGKSLLKPKRVFPFGWTPYYGSQWWSMSIDAVKFTVQLVENKSEYLEYHYYSQLSDELFFQSIILNAYPRKDLIVNDNKRLIEFGSNSSHPKVYTIDDLDHLMESKHLFARKFEENSPILYGLDKVYEENL